MYVWYNDIQPAGMVVDHIDENKLNYNLDNLQLLTIGENIIKGHNYSKYLRTNQFTKDLSQKELLERKELNDEIKECKKKIHRYIKDIRIDKQMKRGIKVSNKSLYMEYMLDIDITKNLLKKEKDKLEKLLSKLHSSN